MYDLSKIYIINQNIRSEERMNKMESIERFTQYVERSTKNKTTTSNQFIKSKIARLVAYEYGLTEEEIEQVSNNQLN